MSKAVRAIIDDVAARGDAAVIDYTQRFDGLALTPETCGSRTPRSMPPGADAARANLPPSPSRRSGSRPITGAQRPEDLMAPTRSASTLGWRWTAIESVGLYVPGGTASYPSSVLMNAVPAKVAGVPRIVMVVPTPRGEINPLVLAAARLAGVDEIIRIGGAQAIAALAYGTATHRAGRQDRRARQRLSSRRPSGGFSARSAST